MAVMNVKRDYYEDPKEKARRLRKKDEESYDSFIKDNRGRPDIAWDISDEEVSDDDRRRRRRRYDSDEEERRRRRKKKVKKKKPRSPSPSPPRAAPPPPPPRQTDSDYESYGEDENGQKRRYPKAYAGLMKSLDAEFAELNPDQQAKIKRDGGDLKKWASNGRTDDMHLAHDMLFAADDARKKEEEKEKGDGKKGKEKDKKKKKKDEDKDDDDKEKKDKKDKKDKKEKKGGEKKEKKGGEKKEKKDKSKDKK